jgi:Zn-dependent M32 family carboxypeptidase
MPEGGAEHRAEQQALWPGSCAGRRPTRGWATSRRPRRAGLAAGVRRPVAVNLRELREEVRRPGRCPPPWRRTWLGSPRACYEALRTARGRRDARVFPPWLDRVVTLKQAEADCVARGGTATTRCSTNGSPVSRGRRSSRCWPGSARRSAA